MVLVRLIHYKWLFMVVLLEEAVWHQMICIYLILEMENRWLNG
jgi:hypothetical protein